MFLPQLSRALLALHCTVQYFGLGFRVTNISTVSAALVLNFPWWARLKLWLVSRIPFFELMLGGLVYTLSAWKSIVTVPEVSWQLALASLSIIRVWEMLALYIFCLSQYKYLYNPLSTSITLRRGGKRKELPEKHKGIRNVQKGIQPENNKSEYDSLEIPSDWYTDLS